MNKEPEQWVKDWGSRLANKTRSTPIPPEDYAGWILNEALEDFKSILSESYADSFYWPTSNGIEISIGSEDDIFGVVELEPLQGKALLEVFYDRLKDEPDEAVKVLAWFEAVVADMKTLIEEEEIWQETSPTSKGIGYIMH